MVWVPGLSVQRPEDQRGDQLALQRYERRVKRGQTTSQNKFRTQEFTHDLSGSAENLPCWGEGTLPGCLKIFDSLGGELPGGAFRFWPAIGLRGEAGVGFVSGGGVTDRSASANPFGSMRCRLSFA